MVQAALADVGIRFVRLDGSFTHDSRKNSLEAFRNEADIKVVLLTISCGAVGYVRNLGLAAFFSY